MSGGKFLKTIIFLSVFMLTSLVLSTMIFAVTEYYDPAHVQQSNEDNVTIYTRRNEFPDWMQDSRWWENSQENLVQQDEEEDVYYDTAIYPSPNEQIAPLAVENA